ncbi:hypothetical protein Lal_00033094 [Lupinus albus]|nr:hypothetical protein Lal_00033094 [Lupinus albus]
MSSVRETPVRFKGFAPDAAIEWIQRLERIFKAMSCCDAQKLAYATYLLEKEAKSWWEFTPRQMEAEGQVILWCTFREKFLRKYFPADLRSRNEMKFLRLEQGNLSVGDYAAKLEELARFCPYSELEADGRSKCSKFESEWVEDDMKADEVVASRSLPPKNFGPQRNFVHRKGKGKAFLEEGKPYSSPMGNRGYIVHGSRTHANTGGSQQHSQSWCNKCDRKHFGDSCPGTTLSCFYCKESGHLKRHCPKLRQSMNAVSAERPRSTGRVFTMSGVEASNVDDLIKGNCMVAGIPLLVLFDSGATHSFVSIECVDRLKLQTESLPFDLVLDLILGMDWLSANHVMLNCADKTVIFGNLDEIFDKVNDMKPLSAKEVRTSCKEGGVVFMLLASLEGIEKPKVEDIPIVRE